MPHVFTSLFFFIYVIGMAWSKSVRVTDLIVPSAAVLGESVTLECSYDLGAEELYVVKWYKDDLEFYRYEPKDDNQSIYFRQPGIDIDLSKSNSNIVVLRNVALNSAGNYKCQVSTDAPTYSCVQAVKEMNVIILPSKGPQISGGDRSYEFGENITLNCTSAESKPAAKLSWLINEKPVAKEATREHGISIKQNILQVSSNSLHLKVTGDLFTEDKVTIKCIASFFGDIDIVTKDVKILEISAASTYFLSTFLLLVSISFSLYLTFRF